MTLQKHLILGIAFVLFMAMGSFQGQRMDDLRDATKFYRWMISSSTQARIFGRDTFTVQGVDGPEYVDEILFRRLVETTETRLDEPPSMGDNDRDEDGQLLPKIVRYSNLHGFSQDGEGVETAVDDAELLKRDRSLWALARSDEADVESLRDDFIVALRNGQLYSAGDQVTLEEFYNQTADFGVSLGNMFFGFRKMAANLVWLEVDKFFHSGMAHRMIPAMQTTVALDPSFVDAYLLGSWHLSYNFTAKMTETPWELREFDANNHAWVGPKERYYYEGIEFLKDGIRKNPRSYKLYFDAGYGIYYEKLDDNHNAVRMLRQAIRPAHDVWVRRQLYRIMTLDGQYEDSIKGWDWYIENFSDNIVAPRMREQAVGLMHERDASRAAVQARAAAELAKLEPEKAAEWQAAETAAREEEAELWDAAAAIWDRLANSVGSADIYALGRQYLQKALRNAEQGRYEEAIAMLDVGRFQSDPLFIDLSNLMIEYKVESGQPLSVTELKAQTRLEEERRYTALLPKSVDGKLYVYRNGAWATGAYTDQTAQEILPDTHEYHRLLFDHPEAAAPFDLGGEVLFRAAEGEWYRFKGEPLTDVINPYEQ